MTDILLKILTKINFVSRYKTICESHNDFHNRLDKTNKKILLNLFKTLDNNVKYEPLDRLYTLGFSIYDFNIEFTSKLHNGLVEPFFHIGNNGNHIFYNRFDFICADLDIDFDRKVYNLPKYSTESELEEILKIR